MMTSWLLAAALTFGRTAAASPAADPPVPAEELPVKLERFTREGFTLLVPRGWKVASAGLVKDPAKCVHGCGLSLLSPAGSPVVDLKVDRHNFYADAGKIVSHRKLVPIPDLDSYLKEYDCARTAPPEEVAAAVGGWVSPRVPWGDTCGSPKGIGKAPLGAIYIHEDFMWRNGLHYWRAKEVPMRAMSVLYDVKGWPGGVLRFSMTAERSVFDRYLPVLQKMVDSFRLKD